MVQMFAIGDIASVEIIGVVEQLVHLWCFWHTSVSAVTIHIPFDCHLAQ